MRKTTAFLGLVALAGALGCGRKDEAFPDPSASDDAGEEAPDAAAVEPRNQLFMVASQYGSGLSGAFLSNPKARPGERCWAAREGTCFTIDCRKDGPSGGWPNSGTLAGAEAGQARITGPSTAAIEFSPEADGTYRPASAKTLRFVEGDEVRFSAAGGSDLPAFSHTIVFPAELEVLRPTDSLVNVERAQGFAAAWTPVAGKVFVALAQEPVGRDAWLDNLQVVCEFDGEKGVGAVSAAALAVFRPEDGTTQSVAAVVRAEKADLSPGGWPLRVVAWSGKAMMVFFK